ncbi:MAG: glycosyltransferase [Gallionellaceae bacterium]|nr:glycosyltransferase [Gallionellaceae bacterium]
MNYRPDHPQVTILVKALNEERHIAACLQAAVREAQRVQGEVVLVDSLSTDRTVEFARHYPVRIVQFARANDCNCGAAVQLGYQFARGDFIYIVDGDMELVPGFLQTALDKLQNDEKLAGVGGQVKDTQVRTISDQRRVSQRLKYTRNCLVNKLDGGGLYRRQAIEAVGYFGHRSLQAYEEAELGYRLCAAGWKLLHLAQAAVLHTGHNETTWQMFRRLWCNRRAHAGGILLRTAWGKPWCWMVIKSQWQIFAPPALHTSAMLAAISLPLFFTGHGWGRFIIFELLLWATIASLMVWRKHNFSAALYSIVAWHYFSLAALYGLFDKVIDPHRPISAREIFPEHNDITVSKSAEILYFDRLKNISGYGNFQEER